MKIKQLEHCLSAKLKLQQRPSGRHIGYQLRCDGSVIPLPTLLRVSHGSGDLADNNLGGVAKGLGLSEHALKETAGCHIGRACVLICVVMRLLDFVHRAYAERGESVGSGLLAMLESVNLLLAEPELTESPLWNAAERRALDRLRESAARMCADPHVGAAAKLVLDRMPLSS